MPVKATLTLFFSLKWIHGPQWILPLHHLRKQKDRIRARLIRLELDFTYFGWQVLNLSHLCALTTPFIASVFNLYNYSYCIIIIITLKASQISHTAVTMRDNFCTLHLLSITIDWHFCHFLSFIQGVELWRRFPEITHFTVKNWSI